MKYSVTSVLAEGLACGKVHILKTKEEVAPSLLNDYQKLDKAIETSLAQIEEMKKNSPELLSYLIVQEFMINDPDLKRRITLLLDSGIPVMQAINAVMEEYMKGLASSPSSYLQERIHDMEDAARRISMNLSSDVKEEPKEPFILCIEKPYPSYLIHHKDLIQGIISKVGGYTSHTAILCRGYDIPFVLSSEDFKEGEEIIIDTRKRILITEPSNMQKNHVHKENDKNTKKAVLHAGFKFLANASEATDVEHAMNYGFDGVGLFRTEMIFMNSNRPLTAIEQYRIYLDAISKLNDNAYIVFRTFDVGGDKKISYMNTHTKGIDNYKNNPYIFENQIMAILKAYTDTNKDIRIMFPMIFKPEEFTYLKNWVRDLAQRFGYKVPPIGMMLETKEALDNIHDFKEVEFISIGTNDLVKSIYSLDRETSFDEIDTFLEDLLKKLRRLYDICERKHTVLSVCGELAAIPEVAYRLYEIGIKNLSISPSLIKMLNQAYTEYVEKNYK